ncbi:MAG TPA: hypothetical protein VIG94_07825 [Faecalibacter sp.]
MKTIKFFHPEETFNYNIEKSLCKVVYQGDKQVLLIEIHTTDELDHVEDDSLQNDYPQLSLYIDDFPMDVASTEELTGKTISIPYGFTEEEDEDGEIHEVYYTSLNVSEGDYEAVDNVLDFSINENGILSLKWTGSVQDFTEETDGDIKFEVNCVFEGFEFNEEEYE